uniref:Chloroplast envelope membrane protein n=1 Tax=Cucumis melo TaxID=3656 RepID=A0A9I9CI17_CUCME
MFLMSTSMLLSHHFIFHDCAKVSSLSNFPSCNSFPKFSALGRKRKGFYRHVLNAKNNGYSRKRSWWQRFFFDDDGNWLGLKDDGMLEDELESIASDEDLSDDEKFEAWKKRAEAIIELKEAQEDVRNEQGQRWTDWLYDTNHARTSWSQDWDNGLGELNEESSDVSDLVPEKGFVESVRDLVLGKEEDDMLYEDRVFQYASLNSAKFLTVLIIIPWALDFVVHDYVLMPFLDRYVKKVPLAAEMLDVRRNQKLEMVEELKIEKERFKLEMEIGKSPPLSDEELWWELRHRALTLRDEWRLENRKAFANIWSDMVFGISLFILLYFNQSKVALLKFTVIILNPVGRLC